MAASTSKKLIDILQRKNPDLRDYWAGTGYQNTSNPGWDEVTLTDQCREHVQPWEDFTYEAIYLAYGDILESNVKNLESYKTVHTPSVTPTEILKEDNIDSLSIVWSCNIVRDPLKQAALELRSRDPAMNIEVKGTPEPTLVPKRVEWKSGSFKPDWTILDRSLSKQYKSGTTPVTQGLVYVHGDSKLKQKWKSTWLSLADGSLQVKTDPPYHKPGTPQPKYDATHDVKLDRVWPLRQMATYCRYAETRYGYIITQDELVALRIRRIGLPNPSDGTARAAIEYKSIPWTASGSQKLTVNLAIWALGCMAMNDTHRHMEGPNHTELPSMARLTSWQASPKEKGAYVNVISRRVISAKEWASFSKGKTVYLDNDAKGNSSTSSFISKAPPMPERVTRSNTAKQGTEGLTKQLDKLSLQNKNASSSTAAAVSSKAFTQCIVDGKKYTLKLEKGVYQASLDKKAWYPLVQDKSKAWYLKLSTKDMKKVSSIS